MPKLPALLQVVPDPVAGAYIFIFLVLLFRQGVRLVTTGGFDYDKGLIVCISFWIGLGFQNGVIFPDHLPQWSRGVLDNGMAAGGIVAMVLTLLVALRQHGQHDVLEPSVRSVSKLRAVLDLAAARAGWDETAVNRLQLAGEEAFLYLLDRQEAESKPQPIRVAVRPVDDVLQIELVSGPDSANLEHRLDKLDAEGEVVRDVGPRILKEEWVFVRARPFTGMKLAGVSPLSVQQRRRPGKGCRRRNSSFYPSSRRDAGGPAGHPRAQPTRRSRCRAGSWLEDLVASGTATPHVEHPAGAADEERAGRRGAGCRPCPPWCHSPVAPLAPPQPTHGGTFPHPPPRPPPPSLPPPAAEPISSPHRRGDHACGLAHHDGGHRDRGGAALAGRPTHKRLSLGERHREAAPRHLAPAPLRRSAAPRIGVVH